LGSDTRDITDIALKLDFKPGFGTFTAISDYNHTKEIDTGDAYDFRPIDTSIANNVFFTFVPPALGGTFDESQSQFVDVTTYSQELRFTSQKIGGFFWIARAYSSHPDFFIST
jgi:iron complex outermembrane receptor protein